MKSTYKLLSIYLDKLSIPHFPPVVEDRNHWDDAFDIKHGPTIFDSSACKRFVSGISLLSYNSIDQIRAYTKALPLNTDMAVLLDYTSGLLVADQLFVIRVLQAIQLLIDNKLKINIHYAAQREKIQFYTSIINSIYLQKLTEP